MIVQELMKVQERVGWLPQEELRALASAGRAPAARHEVASFYPHYCLQPPPWMSSVPRHGLHLRGSPRLKASLTALANELGPRRSASRG